MGYHSVFKDILQATDLFAQIDVAAHHGAREQYSNSKKPVDIWHTVHKEKEIKLEIGKEFPGTPLEGHFGVVRRQDIISGLAKAVYNNPNITVRTKHKAVKLVQNEQLATVQELAI